MTAVRELSAGMTFRGKAVHACWREPFRGGATYSPLCRRAFITSPRPEARVTCVHCLQALDDADFWAKEVMRGGEPGGSPSQHDDECALACSCGPDPDSTRWCRRHEGMWLDPEARQTLRAGGCDRLPGCHWPSAGGDGR